MALTESENQIESEVKLRAKDRTDLEEAQKRCAKFEEEVSRLSKKVSESSRYSAIMNNTVSTRPANRQQNPDDQQQHPRAAMSVDRAGARAAKCGRERAAPGRVAARPTSFNENFKEQSFAQAASSTAPLNAVLETRHLAEQQRRRRYSPPLRPGGSALFIAPVRRQRSKARYSDIVDMTT